MTVDPDARTHASEARPDPFLGRTVDGYRVEEVIGHGGMGTVYRATQLSLERPVALKLLTRQRNLIIQGRKNLPGYVGIKRLKDSKAHHKIVAADRSPHKASQLRRSEKLVPVFDFTFIEADWIPIICH